jgi:hypothetical protein
MPSKSRSAKRAPPRTKPSKPAARPTSKKPTVTSKRPPPKLTAKVVPKSTKSSKAKGGGADGPVAAPTVPALEIPLPGGRRHVLSLSFVRDGDEFMARLETDSGHITELKNRALDQLLTLVAGELEDLLE